MELLELEEKQTLGREAAAARLRAIADALERHNGLTLERNGKRIEVRVPDQVELEIEVEVEDDGGKIELELGW
jgi:amphi-Trp domain-containing protein